jgi:hypothetical protein
MVDIADYLKQSKPDLSQSTVSAYTVNLEKLHDRLHGTRSFEDLRSPPPHDEQLAHN